MTDLKFKGVNYPTDLVEKQADPVTDRLLLNNIGPTGGANGPLTVKPVIAVAGKDAVIVVVDGPALALLMSIAGNGNIDLYKPWANNKDVSWSDVLRITPSTAPDNGTNGSIHIVTGSGNDPSAGLGTAGEENPPAGSLMLQTTGEAPWLKTGSGATDWLQLASATSSGKQYATVVVGNALEGDSLANCDIVDPGDGTGIEAAIALCGTTVGEVTTYLGDVLVRPGTYDLTASAVITPMEIPVGVVLKGAGVGLTTIIARSDPNIFSMSMFDVAGTLLDCTLEVGPPSLTNAGTQDYLVNVQYTGVIRRVSVSLLGLGNLGYASFGLMHKIFAFTNGSILEECTVDGMVNSPTVSFLADGASYTLNSFSGAGKDNGFTSFRLDRCSVRGTDTAFSSLVGPGYFSNCYAENSEYSAFTVVGSYVKIIEPTARWTSTPTTTSTSYYGALLLGCSDCEISGGSFVTVAAGSTNPAVEFASSGAAVDRNKVNGVTFTGWVTGVQFDTTAASSKKFNSIQLCTFYYFGIVVYVTDGSDTNTVVANNIVDDA